MLIRAGGIDHPGYHGIIRYLGVLSGEEYSASGKCRFRWSEFGIRPEHGMRKVEEIMSTLGEGLYQYAKEKIAAEYLKAVMESLNVSADEAARILDMDDPLRTEVFTRPGIEA